MDTPDGAVEEIFHAALDRADPAEREAFVAGACEGAPDLKQRVSRLLEMHESADGQFENLPLSAEIEAEQWRGRPEDAGEWIGPYKLLEQIGEGGFGVVWMAEQERPVRRRVALKILKQGMDTKEVIARFEQERQALAMMEHPNIARVFDAGATQLGRPYFVMELVRGVRITDYCDLHQLPMRERVELFIRVCQAVQHAHQKGIIHRDLKPSNILVTVNDGEPVPKVIDFGVAKATQGRITDGTLFTHSEQIVGTPLYMSPEQAEMTSLDIDTRSDIYSLGVLLYELLTGGTPLDTATMARAGLDEIRRLIREVDPPRPSVRVRTMTGEALTSTAKRRQAEGSKFPAALRGDLDWIVMKCLEKDRKRRYDTANSLVLDLQRHLANEVVGARPPTAVYLVEKFARRHRGPVLAAAAVLFVLCAGLVISTMLYLRERQAWASESAQRAKAQTAAAKSEQSVKFMMDMLSAIHPESAKGRDVSVLTEMLERAERQVATELRDQPEVQADLHGMIGRVYGSLGLYPKARPHLEQARTLRQSLLGREHAASLSATRELAALCRLQGHLPEAEGLILPAARLARRALGGETLATLEIGHEVANIREAQGRFREAHELRLETFETCRRVFGPENPATLRMRSGLPASFMELAKNTEGKSFSRETLAIKRRVFGPDHPETLAEMTDLADCLRRLEEFAEAEAIYRETWEIERRIHGPEHPRTLMTMGSLSLLINDLGRHDEAEMFLRDILEISRRVLGPEHRSTLFAMRNLALAFDRQAKKVEAETLSREAVEISRRVLGPEHPETLKLRVDLAAILRNMANVSAEAAALQQKSLEAQQRIVGPEHRDSLFTADQIRRTHLAERRFDEAEALCREVVESNRRTLGDDHIMAIVWQCRLALTLREAGKFSEAEASFRQTMEVARRSLARDHSVIVTCLTYLAELVEKTGRWDEVMSFWAETWELRPDDTLLPLGLATMQAWFGREGEHLETCRKFASRVEGTKDAFPAERAAKAFLLRPLVDATMREQAYKLAQHAFGQRHLHREEGHYHLCLGMAEYRCGNFTAADAALLESERLCGGAYHVRDTSRFFRAMSLFRQGRAEEARKLFATAVADLPAPPPPVGQRPTSGVGHDIVIVWLIHHEAKELLATTP